MSKKSNQRMADLKRLPIEAPVSPVETALREEVVDVVEDTVLELPSRVQRHAEAALAVLDSPDQPQQVLEHMAEFTGEREVVEASAAVAKRYLEGKINQNYNHDGVAPTGLTGFGSDESDFRDPTFEMGG